MRNLQKWNICPVLLYYRFRNKDDVDMPNCVTIDSFERDMKSLIDAGYVSVSLSQIVDARKQATALAENAFCLVFLGGYEDNYTLAFPVLKKLGLRADVFIETELVGCTSSSDEPSFLPRFNWVHAKEMIDSGLVKIHPLWNPSEEKVEWSLNIERNIVLLRNNLKIDLKNLSFYSNRSDDDENYHKALSENHIPSYIIPFWLINIDRLNNGAMPFICVDEASMVFDVIEEFCEKCYDRLNRDETVLDENIETTWRKESYRTVELPVEKKPLIRNFLRQAFPLSVVAFDRKDKAELFVIYEHIDVVFRPWYHWFDYDNCLYDSWGIIKCCRLERDIIIANKLNVVECILNGLNAGYYCDIWLDTYYIPGKPGYGEYHISHCLLAYGYDNAKNVIKTLTYTETGHYEELDVEPENVIKACSNSFFKYLNFMKMNRESQMVYKKDELICRLEDYLYSKYKFSANSKYNEYDSNQLCNKEACDSFSTYILETANKEQRVYPVALYGFLEHKKCMGWRLQWIFDREGIADKLIKDFEKDSSRMCWLGINLGIKYNATKNTKVLSQLNELIIKINDRETEAIKRAISILKNK